MQQFYSALVAHLSADVTRMY